MQAKYIVGPRSMSKSTSNMQVEDIFWNSIPDTRAQAAGSSSCGSYIAACWVNLGNKSVLLREGAYPILTGNVTWRRQEFGHNNKDSIPLRGISCASGERLAALAFRLRRTLAPSALALALDFPRASGARIWVNCLESSLWQRLDLHETIYV